MSVSTPVHRSSIYPDIQRGQLDISLVSNPREGRMYLTTVLSLLVILEGLTLIYNIPLWNMMSGLLGGELWFHRWVMWCASASLGKSRRSQEEYFLMNSLWIPLFCAVK